MIWRVVFALVIGLMAQALALFTYMALAASSPYTPLKHVGFVVLAVGSAWAIRLLYGLGKKPAMACMFAMACIAPVMPALVRLPKASERISFSADYLLIYAQGAFLVLLGYGILWLLVTLVASREKHAWNTA